MYTYSLSIISFKRHQVGWWSSTLDSSGGSCQMVDPVWSVASVVITEPKNISLIFSSS